MFKVGDLVTKEYRNHAIGMVTKIKPIGVVADKYLVCWQKLDTGEPCVYRSWVYARDIVKVQPREDKKNK